MKVIINRFKEALLSMDRLAVNKLLLDSSLQKTPIELIEAMVMPALESIGEDWEKGSVALSQVYMSGVILEKLIDDILPQSSPDRKSQPKMAITVLEDYHVLGKKIVFSVIRSRGFELIDYGIMVVDNLVKRAIEDKIEILLISTLMLPSALHVKDVISKIKENGTKIKIVVGGAPFRFDDRLWKEVGADAMCRNSSEIFETISRLTGDIS